jgi:hypothetical protein
MNVWKLIRGFCKVTNTPYRTMKKQYMKMSAEQKTECRKQLLKGWEENKTYLNHKEYYNLKNPLVPSRLINEKVEI